jgi:predicted CopG family antitoxin
MGSKHIRISQENYKTLKKLGEAGDSFNDVITEMLKKIE